MNTEQKHELTHPCAETCSGYRQGFEDGVKSMSHVVKQMAVFRKAIVYGRHALSIPDTKKEKECAEILEAARKEGDEILKRSLK